MASQYRQVRVQRAHEAIAAAHPYRTLYGRTWTVAVFVVALLVSVSAGAVWAWRQAPWAVVSVAVFLAVSVLSLVSSRRRAVQRRRVRAWLDELPAGDED